jgi:uncharacterized membrane-anchored protein YitT (DUF2179 family)
MSFLKRMWPTIQDYILIITGSLIQAVALRIFFIPAQLASGGVSGLAQLVNYFTGWPIGVMVFIGNLPLLLLGWRYLGGRRFAMRTAAAILTLSFLTDALLWLPFFPRQGLTNDLVLNSLYGAVVAGGATVWFTAVRVPAAAVTSWPASSTITAASPSRRVI